MSDVHTRIDELEAKLHALEAELTELRHEVAPAPVASCPGGTTPADTPASRSAAGRSGLRDRGRSLAAAPRLAAAYAPRTEPSRASSYPTSISRRSSGRAGSPRSAAP